LSEFLYNIIQIEIRERKVRESGTKFDREAKKILCREKILLLLLYYFMKMMRMSVMGQAFYLSINMAIILYTYTILCRG